MSGFSNTWVFADWNVPSDVDIIRAADIGFTDFVFGAARSPNGKFAIVGDETSWDRIRDAVKVSGMKLHIMPFVYRKSKYLSDMVDEDVDETVDSINELVDLMRPKSVLLNIEGPGVRGAASVSSGCYIAALLGLKDRLPVGVELGIVYIHPMAGIIKDIVNVGLADYVIPEGYSFWSNDGTRAWSHTVKLYPGDFQRRIVAEHKVIDDNLMFHPRMVMGLAAYDLAIPAQSGKDACTPEENIELCYWACKHSGVKEIAFWSLKHLIGASDSHRRKREAIRDLYCSSDRCLGSSDVVASIIESLYSTDCDPLVLREVFERITPMFRDAIEQGSYDDSLADMLGCFKLSSSILYGVIGRWILKQHG